MHILLTDNGHNLALSRLRVARRVVARVWVWAWACQMVAWAGTYAAQLHVSFDRPVNSGGVGRDGRTMTCARAASPGDLPSADSVSTGEVDVCIKPALHGGRRDRPVQTRVSFPACRALEIG